MIKLTTKAVSIFFLFTNIVCADLIKTNIALKPFDVLTIQLNSLKNNNVPYKDAGIEQTWIFAHPDNKLLAGSLKNFKRMIYSKNYQMLLGHINSETVILNETNNKNVYKVYILSKDKKKYYFIWQIEKVKEKGDIVNCWMTTSVSAPEYLGEII